MSCGSPFAIRMPPYVRTTNHNAEPPIVKPHIYLDKAFLLVHLSRPALLANFADTDGIWPYHIAANNCYIEAMVPITAHMLSSRLPSPTDDTYTSSPRQLLHPPQDKL